MQIFLRNQSKFRSDLGVKMCRSFFLTVECSGDGDILQWTMFLFLEGEHRQRVNCHFRPNRLKKRHPPPWMSAIHTTHTSAFLVTTIVVWIYLCVPSCFSNATLNLFGQSETVWHKGFFLFHPFSFFLSLSFVTPSSASGDPDHYLKLLFEDSFPYNAFLYSLVPYFALKRRRLAPSSRLVAPEMPF